MPGISSLECSKCHHVSADTSQTVCPQCGSSRYVFKNVHGPEHAAKREEMLKRHPLPVSLPVGGIITPQ
jgi:threonine synthase